MPVEEMDTPAAAIKPISVISEAEIADFPIGHLTVPQANKDHRYNSTHIRKLFRMPNDWDPNDEYVLYSEDLVEAKIKKLYQGHGDKTLVLKLTVSKANDRVLAIESDLTRKEMMSRFTYPDIEPVNEFENQQKDDYKFLLSILDQQLDAVIDTTISAAMPHSDFTPNYVERLLPKLERIDSKPDAEEKFVAFRHPKIKLDVIKFTKSENGNEVLSFGSTKGLTEYAILPLKDSDPEAYVYFHNGLGLPQLSKFDIETFGHKITTKKPLAPIVPIPTEDELDLKNYGRVKRQLVKNYFQLYNSYPSRRIRASQKYKDMIESELAQRILNAHLIEGMRNSRLGKFIRNRHPIQTIRGMHPIEYMRDLHPIKKVKSWQWFKKLTAKKNLSDIESQPAGDDTHAPSKIHLQPSATAPASEAVAHAAKAATPVVMPQPISEPKPQAAVTTTAKKNSNILSRMAKGIGKLFKRIGKWFHRKPTDPTAPIAQPAFSKAASVPATVAATVMAAATPFATPPAVVAAPTPAPAAQVEPAAETVVPLTPSRPGNIQLLPPAPVAEPAAPNPANQNQTQAAAANALEHVPTGSLHHGARRAGRFFGGGQAPNHQTGILLSSEVRNTTVKLTSSSWGNSLTL